jgi:hypothetical protein
VTPCTKRTEAHRATPVWYSSMGESTRRISRTNPMDWPRRMQPCGRSWSAGTFRSMEVCWHAMALFRDCLRMSTVADTGEDMVVGATLSISAVPVPRHPRNRGAQLIRLPDSQEIAAGTHRPTSRPRIPALPEDNTTESRYMRNDFDKDKNRRRCEKFV